MRDVLSFGSKSTISVKAERSEHGFQDSAARGWKSMEINLDPRSLCRSPRRTGSNELEARGNYFLRRADVVNPEKWRGKGRG